MKLTLITKYFLTIFLSKKSYVVGSLLFSFSLVTVLDRFLKYVGEHENNVSIVTLSVLIALTGIFIVADFITGIIASRYEGGRIQSTKWGITIGKLFGVLLYYLMAFVIVSLISDNYFTLTILFGPILLTILKEYISIGENFERVFRKKAYMFTIIDRIFDILEKKFFKTLEDKDICNFEEREEENKSE